MDISLGGAKSLITSHKELVAASGFVLGVSKVDIDYATAHGDWGPGLDRQAKLIADSVLGRTIGYNPWPDVAKFNQTNFSISRALFNNGTYFIVAAEIAKGLTSNKLVSDIAAIGEPFAGGYAVGKGFDPPSGNIGASNYSPTYEGSSTGINPFTGVYA